MKRFGDELPHVRPRYRHLGYSFPIHVRGSVKLLAPFPTSKDRAWNTSTPFAFGLDPQPIGDSRCPILAAVGVGLSGCAPGVYGFYGLSAAPPAPGVYGLHGLELAPRGPCLFRSGPALVDWYFSLPHGKLRHLSAQPLPSIM